ncbi:MAG: GGDEF domain-containing phosphodiesterase, partial [Cyanobacteria bacterium P01_D01_bin.73]
EAVAIANCIQRSLEKPLKVETREVFASMSIGIAALTEDCQRPEDLLRHADTAMYHHKLHPRTPFAIFDEAMHLKARARLQLEMDLYRATTTLEQPSECQMQVYYQPIMDLRTGQLAGFEALVRWFHPERGLISPEEFIPVAEETSAIAHIGNWVMNQACGQLRQWQQQASASDNLFMSVNVATCQFLQADFVDRLDQVLSTHNIRPQDLKLEITETALMQTVGSVQQVLSAIHNLGVKLSLDDFGTGYSSLSYLHKLSIDTLKIDRSFISTHESDGGSIAETVLMLARGLGLEVVAEGVETSDQCEWLRELQCDFGQGYLFSKPLPPHQLEDLLLKSHSHTPREFRQLA